MAIATDSAFRHSSLREKIVEHSFVAALLKLLWTAEVFDVEIAHPEIDNLGTDLVRTRGRLVRDLQLKASSVFSKVQRQSINLALGAKPSGCVVWVQFDPKTFGFEKLFWFGGEPGEPLPDISGKPRGRHAKGNAKGEKLERATFE